MSEVSKSKAVPRLRFPEFRHAWEHKPLAPYLQECRSRVAATTSLPVYSSSRAGLTPQANYYDGRTVINEGEYGVVPPNCFVYRHMSDDGQFAFNLNETGSEIAVSKEYPVFRTVDLDCYFLLAKLNHSPDFKAFALSQKAGGTRTRLYFSKLREWETFLPSLAEQHKIADCLTSLDEVIAAQKRKVEALKSYKRGLMQQLFPREGETLPRLRFPEFRDAPDWEEAQLGDLFDTTSGGTPDRAKKEYWNGTVPWVTTSLIDFNVITKVDEFISEAGLENSSAKVLPKGTVLIAMYGQGKTRAKVAMLGIAATTNQACAAILPNDKIDQRFTFASLCGRYEEMRALSNSGGQENLSQGLIRGLPFRYPKDIEEQSKIVGCLSSLDLGIYAESDKLEALKTHKKGLMQQLFPSPEEGL
jgi:type I restriction enzyme S subunit